MVFSTNFCAIKLLKCLHYRLSSSRCLLQRFTINWLMSSLDAIALFPSLTAGLILFTLKAAFHAFFAPLHQVKKILKSYLNWPKPNTICIIITVIFFTTQRLWQIVNVDETSTPSNLRIYSSTYNAYHVVEEVYLFFPVN